tara:strand:+ start:115 stop:1038 length:924 start_codon:yes stop_codon:yes gene_type:complete
MVSNHSIPEKISNLVQGSIVEFIKRVANTYDGLSPEDLVKIWNSDPGTSSLINIDVGSVTTKSKPKSPVRHKKAATPKPSSPSSTSPQVPSDTPSPPTTCGYILTKGARADQPCGLKSRKGGIFCSRHKAHENVCKPCTKSIPVASRASPNKLKTSSEEFSNNALTFRRHDSIPDCYYHTKTNFVRKSGGGLYVDRKIVDGQLVPLTSDDLDVCNANQLTLAPELQRKESSLPEPEEPKTKAESKTMPKVPRKRPSNLPPKAASEHADNIQTLDRVETDVRSAILNMNADAIAIEAVLRELQVSPRN